MDSEQCMNTDSKLFINVTTRATNAVLDAFIARHGGVAKAAEHLGITQSMLSAWRHFRSMPSVKTGKPRIVHAMATLERETDVSITDIFPDLSRDQLAWLAARRVKAMCVGPERITQAIEREKLAYVEEAAEINERTAVICNALTTSLNERERLVIAMRYGLDGHSAMTLEEVGKRIGVTKDRVRHIECKAIRRLQKPHNAEKLASFVE